MLTLCLSRLWLLAELHSLWHWTEGLGDMLLGDWKPPSVPYSGLSGYNMALTSSEQANESQRREGEGERE